MNMFPILRSSFVFATRVLVEDLLWARDANIPEVDLLAGQLTLALGKDS